MPFLTPAACPLLHTINSPADLRQLPESQLCTLAAELRQFLIHSVSKTGGHLAASLGVIELTIALHYVYQTPEDCLIWDTGHQAYPHKILTGRRQHMSRLRQKNGISGFPKRDESPYDCFGVGHAGTSISAALGMAVMHQLQQPGRKSIAVIGDGALTAGMAFEALNHAGHLRPDLLVILNDNNMSISPNVGGLAEYLGKILASRLYITVREEGKRVLNRLPSPMLTLAKRAEEHVKGMITPGTLFEELGFNYVGPLDGHDLPQLVATLRNLRLLKGPQFLHMITRKGQGYPPAEEDPQTYHGVGRFDPKTGQSTTPPQPLSYTQVFGEWLCEMAAQDPRLMAITPAMGAGSGMLTFAQRYPHRYFDVGIAEQHSLTFAAGLACAGAKPVIAIYSTFLQRGYDQLIHDIALQNLPVLLAIDRAGPVGPDGATHTGNFDISFLRCIPNLVMMTPSDENECWHLLTTGYYHTTPCAVRYPRGCGPGTPLDRTFDPLPIGKAMIRRMGDKIALLAFGPPLAAALVAATPLNATVVDMRFVKPLDETLLKELAQTHPLWVTLEENSLQGGAGSAVNEYISTLPNPPRLIMLGLADEFPEQASREELITEAQLDAASILRRIQASLTNESL